MESTFNLKLTRMAHGGAALGRHEGKVIFVPYALPGEMVRVEIVDDRERFAHARLLEVLEPSPDRAPPPCPHFGPQSCGGCQWQHAQYAAQLGYKTDVVIDQLTHIGRLTDPPVKPVLADATGWGYRNQARFHVAPDGPLGFRTAASEQVVPIDECRVLHPLLADLYDILDMDLPGLESLTLRAGTATGDRLIVFETEDEEPPSLLVDLPVSCAILLPDGTVANLVGRNHFFETVAGYTFRVSASSFFQANTEQAAQLVRIAHEYLDLQGGETVLDGYCGVGLFTASLAEHAGLVIAVEVDPLAVDDLMENTAQAENVQVIESSLDVALANVEEPLDAALVDPPRTGLEREALEELTAARPRRIVYVSCDPATLARDGGQLARAGYHLAEVQPVDMFPQTFHIETVSLWTLE